jgi:hypothetical protein
MTARHTVKCNRAGPECGACIHSCEHVPYRLPCSEDKCDSGLDCTVAHKGERCRCVPVNCGDAKTMLTPAADSV